MLAQDERVKDVPGGCVVIVRCPGILMRRYRRLYGDEDCLGQCVALSFTVAASRYSKQCCKVNVVELLTKCE